MRTSNSMSTRDHSVLRLVPQIPIDIPDSLVETYIYKLLRRPD